MRVILSIIAAATCLGLATPANAEPGRIASTVNVRAGPGTEFPRIGGLSRGQSIDVRGCLQDRSWCDVTWRGGRGWISARFLEVTIGGARRNAWDNRTRVTVPTLSWNLDSYWTENYRSRDFYRQRDNYRRYGPQSQAASRPSNSPSQHGQQQQQERPGQQPQHAPQQQPGQQPQHAPQQQSQQPGARQACPDGRQPGTQGCPAR